MKKNYTLRFLSCCISVVLMLSSSAYGAELPIFFGVGLVAYEKNFNEADSKKGLTISVTGVNEVWDDTEWANEDTDVFVYPFAVIKSYFSNTGCICIGFHTGLDSIFSSSKATIISNGLTLEHSFIVAADNQ